MPRHTRHEMPAHVKWLETTRLYVVGVPGPAVVGLPTSERLNLFTINVDDVVTKPDEQIAMHATKTHLKPILKKDWEHAEANMHKQHRRPETRIPRAI